MGLQHYQDLESWCVSNKSLRGKIIKHPNFGQLQINNISEAGISVVGYNFLIPKQNFVSQLSPEDISELTIKWKEHERSVDEKEKEIEEQKIQERIKKDQILTEKNKKEAELDLLRQSFSEMAERYELNIREFVSDSGPTDLGPILLKIDGKEDLMENEIEWLKNKTKWRKNSENRDLIKGYANLLGIYYYLLYKDEVSIKSILPFPISLLSLPMNTKDAEKHFSEYKIWNLANSCKYFRKAAKPDKTIEISEDFSRVTQTSGYHEAEAAVFTSRGAAFKDAGVLDQAELNALRAIGLSPHSFYPYNLLGAIYYQKNNCQKGDEYFNEAIRLGSLPDVQESEIKSVLKESGEDSKRNIIDYLFRKDPIKYKWVLNFK